MTGILFAPSVIFEMVFGGQQWLNMYERSWNNKSNVVLGKTLKNDFHFIKKL